MSNLFRKYQNYFLDYKNDLDGIDLKSPRKTIKIEMPARANLVGGWTDTPPYSFENPAAVINTTLSFDENITSPIIITIKHNTNFNVFYNGQLNFSMFQIVNEIVKFMKLNQKNLSIEIHITNQIPKGSGLGGSSLLMAGVISGILSYYINPNYIKKNITKIIDYTLTLEQLIKNGGGWQDQIGGIFPNIKLITTKPQEPHNYFIDSNSTKLIENKSILIYSGISRRAGAIIKSISEKYQSKDKKVEKVLIDLKNSAIEAWRYYKLQKYFDFVKIIQSAGEKILKIEPNSKISIIEKINFWKIDGIIGRIVLGAGNNGFGMFFCKDKKSRDNAIEQISKKLTSNYIKQGIQLYKPTFSNPGLRIISQNSKIDFIDISKNQNFYLNDKK